MKSILSQLRMVTKPVSKRLDKIVVILLLLLGTGVRIISFGHIPPGLYHDEAQNGIDALHILEGEFPLYFEANNGREPIFIYLVAVSVGILGRSPFAVRLPSFYAGFLTLAATYNLARALFNRKTALYALAVLTVTFWHIQLSRVAFRAILLPLFTALYLSAIVRAIRYKKPAFWTLGGVLYGISWYTYMAARFTPVAIIGVMIYFIGTYKTWAPSYSPRQALKGIMCFVMSALLFLLPLGVYTLNHPDVVLTRSGQVSIFNDEINAGDFAGTLVRHTLRSLGMFIFRGDRIWRHNLPYRPVWQLGLSVAFLIGFGISLAGFRKKPYLAVPLLWTIVMLMPTLMAEDAPHYLRAVGVLPTSALLPAIGLSWLQDLISRHFRSPITPHTTPFRKFLAIFSIPFLFWSSSCILSIHDYFVSYAKSPMTYHWFEAGPVAMAETMNSLLGQGWNGNTILRGSRESRTVCIDEQLWKSWTAVPFLVPEETICFLPDDNPKIRQGTVFVVWPYNDWRKTILPILPHPSYLYINQGPTAQGDLDPEPFVQSLFIFADPIPPTPPHIAQYGNGMGLRAALVETVDKTVIVNLWWDTEMPQVTPATVYVHYLRDGIRIAQHDGQPENGRLPTTEWVPGDLILDRHYLPNTTPDMNIDSLRIGLYDSYSGEIIPRILENNRTEPWLETGIILKP